MIAKGHLKIYYKIIFLIKYDYLTNNIKKIAKKSKNDKNST